MGLKDKRRELLAEKEAAGEREAATVEAADKWEYVARNLDKVPGFALEDDFNQHGQRGFEFVAVANGYAIFKRPL